MEKIRETKIEGCYEITNEIFSDLRGQLVKFFHIDKFKKFNFFTNYEEQYFSTSRKNVVRGLHFQAPPNEHIKLVSCLSGSIIDVVVDLRKSSRTYGDFYATELNGVNRKSLYVPEGLAHGFCALTENVVFISLNSKKYAMESDKGIRWNSIGFDWGIHKPIVSDKDKNLPELIDFISPF